MNADFEISCQDWIADVGGDAERDTLTNLVIRASGSVLTRLENVLAKSTRDGPRVSAYLLARWIAANWWRLRYEPAGTGSAWQMSHKIGAAGGGYVWPDITFEGDGSIVMLHGRATEGSSREPIRYLESFAGYVVVDDFITGIETFIEQVTERIYGSLSGGDDLQEIWSEVRRERSDERLAKIRHLEALIGCDPGEAPDGLIDEINARGAVIGEEAAQEVAAANQAQSIEILDELSDGASKLAQEVQIPDIKTMCERVSRETRKERLPWQKGEVAARIARQVWVIDPGPIDNMKLSELFSVRQDFICSGDQDGKVPMAVGYRNGGGDKISVVLKKRRLEGRRFILARLVADHLDAKEADRLLPATDAKTARQKYQRAFAHEFLCPYKELVEMLGSGRPEDDAIEEAANRYLVSPLMVKTKLVNKKNLERDDLPDY